jgi:ubiquinone/menaquinone biosynthesis C-methylase UbiE
MMHNLSPAQRAQQLGQPAGELGLAVAAWMNEANRPAYASFIQQLALTRDMNVLEIGPGNGSHAGEIVASAPGIHYTGLDISPLMVAEANRLNADLVAGQHVGIYLGSAEAIPFGDASFDRVFAIGVMHFWSAPHLALREVRRVLRPGGIILLGGQSPKSADETFNAANGVFLRPAVDWENMATAAGFRSVEAEELAVDLPGSDGAPTTRYALRLAARA